MKWILPLIALVAATPSIVRADDTAPAPKQSWSGQHSGVGNKESVVVRSDADLAKLWKRIHTNRTPVPDVPKVDFTKSIVVASFMGTQRTGGFSITIGEPSMKEGALVVPVSSSIPVGGMVAQVITSPWAAHVIEVEDPKIEVRFAHKKGLAK